MIDYKNIEEFYEACKKRKKYLLLIVAFPLIVISLIFRKRILSTEVLNNSKSKPINANEVAINFVNNMRYMNAICNSRDIDFYSALQPMNGIGDRTLTERDKVTIKAYKNMLLKNNYSRFNFFNDYYKHVKRESAKNKYFKDFTNVFDKEKGQIFFDTIHFSDKGQEIVAQALFELIEEEQIQ